MADELKQADHLDSLLVYIEAAALPWVFSRRPQLGLYYLAQYASDKGYRVRVDNLSSNDYLVRRLSRILNEHSCLFLGLYVDQDNLWTLRRILPSLKKLMPDLNIILGGPQFTADPELTLARIPEALCGVVGEGEKTFVELLSLPCLTTETLKNCRGLVINSQGSIFRTNSREPIEHLDDLSIPQRKQLSINPDTANIPIEIPFMHIGTEQESTSKRPIYYVDSFWAFYYLLPVIHYQISGIKLIREFNMKEKYNKKMELTQKPRRFFSKFKFFSGFCDSSF